MPHKSSFIHTVILSIHINSNALSTPFRFTTFHHLIHSQSSPIWTLCHLNCVSFPHHLLSLIHNFRLRHSLIHSYFLTMGPATHIHSTLLLIHLHSIAFCLSKFIPNLSFIHQYNSSSTRYDVSPIYWYTNQDREIWFNLTAHINTSTNTSDFQRLERDSSLGGSLGQAWQLQGHQRTFSSVLLFHQTHLLPHGPKRLLITDNTFMVLIKYILRATVVMTHQRSKGPLDGSVTCANSMLGSAFSFPHHFT